MDNSRNFMFYSLDNGKINVPVIVDDQRDTIWTTQKDLYKI